MGFSDRSTVGWHVRSCVRTTLVAAAIAVIACSTHAQDLGVIGPVYPIAEPSLLEVILAKLRDAQASGELARIERNAQTRVRQAIEDPVAVTIKKTSKPRSFYFDPSIVVPYPITDAEGTVIVAQGTRVNPLDTVSLSKRLLFFDARDSEQVQRARALLDQYRGQIKLILTGGSYLDLMRRWQQPVFFDQRGVLVEKLRIQHVPALVSQDGKRLRIDELP
jgi:conjugal transfer pilus assembly protein TraW